jgi:hypothetical protein
MGVVFENKASIVYKDHTITCQLTLSQDGEHFVPEASISWTTNGRFMIYFLRSSKECSTGEEASVTAIQEAKRWVDNAVSHLSDSFWKNSH